MNSIERLGALSAVKKLYSFDTNNSKFDESLIELKPGCLVDSISSLFTVGIDYRVELSEPLAIDDSLVTVRKDPWTAIGFQSQEDLELFERKFTVFVPGRMTLPCVLLERQVLLLKLGLRLVENDLPINCRLSKSAIVFRTDYRFEKVISFTVEGLVPFITWIDSVYSTSQKKEKEPLKNQYNQWVKQTAEQYELWAKEIVDSYLETKRQVEGYTGQDVDKLRAVVDWTSSLKKYGEEKADARIRAAFYRAEVKAAALAKKLAWHSEDAFKEYVDIASRSVIDSDAELLLRRIAARNAASAKTAEDLFLIAGDDYFSLRVGSEPINLLTFSYTFITTFNDIVTTRFDLQYFFPSYTEEEVEWLHAVLLKKSSLEAIEIYKNADKMAALLKKSRKLLLAMFKVRQNHLLMYLDYTRGEFVLRVDRSQNITLQ